MKKLKVLFVICACLLLTACDNSFAKAEYNADDKIVKQDDRYAKEMSIFNTIDGGYTLTVSKFNGRETLWNTTCDTAKDIEIKIQLSIAEGCAKVVSIDADGKIVTLAECTAENTPEVDVTQKVLLSAGNNRIKIVGADCKDLKLTMLSADF